MPWSLVLILLMALALRILVVLPPAIDWDESWVGVGAMNVLKGVFPPFFYGQPYMASLEDFLHALVFAGAGPARWSLKVVPVIVAVVFVYLAFRLALRIFDGEAAYAVALVAAFPPPHIVSWTVSARLHYSLTPVLGVLFLLVAVEVMIRPEARQPARWFVLGLLSGLIWWQCRVVCPARGPVSPVPGELRPVCGPGILRGEPAPLALQSPHRDAVRLSSS